MIANLPFLQIAHLNTFILVTSFILDLFRSPFNENLGFCSLGMGASLFTEVEISSNGSIGSSSSVFSTLTTSSAFPGQSETGSSMKTSPGKASICIFWRFFGICGPSLWLICLWTFRVIFLWHLYSQKSQANILSNVICRRFDINLTTFLSHKLWVISYGSKLLIWSETFAYEFWDSVDVLLRNRKHRTRIIFRLHHFLLRFQKLIFFWQLLQRLYRLGLLRLWTQMVHLHWGIRRQIGFKSHSRIKILRPERVHGYLPLTWGLSMELTLWQTFISFSPKFC